MRYVVAVGVGLVIALTWLIETGWLRAQEWTVPNYRHQLGYRRRHSSRAITRRGGEPRSVAILLRDSRNHLTVRAQLLAVAES